MEIEDSYGLRYKLNKDNKTAKVIGVYKQIKNVLIPRKINYQLTDYIVTAIGNAAFSNSIYQKSISFDSDSEVTKIEGNAFELSSIESLSIPSKFQFFEEFWCQEANSISHIVISPQNKNFIYYDDKMILSKSDSSEKVFDNLIFVRRDVTDIKIPTFIKHISSFAFDGCSKIKSFEITEDSELRTIGKCALANTTIKKLYIPSKFEKFEDRWCEDTNEIDEIIVSKDNSNFIVYENSFILGKSNQTNNDYDVLYFARRNLKNVKIPSFIKYLNSYSFDKCEKIESIDFEENSQLLSIGDYCFYECLFERISIPSSVKSICRFAFADSSLKYLDFCQNSNLSIIDFSSFANTNITKVVFPASLNIIDTEAFNSTPIKQIEFEENSKLLSINEYAFADSDLYQVLIPSSVELIYSGAFSYCDNLRLVEILSKDSSSKDDVQKISICENAFFECPNFISLFVSSNCILTIFNDVIEID